MKSLFKTKNFRRFLTCMAMAVMLQACAQADVPDARNVRIPTPTGTDERQEAINERPDSVMYLPLGQDVLVPEVSANDPLPDTEVGPFELRGETLAGALQLILADYEVPLAFQTDNGLTRQVTVANLKGPLNKVVRRVCGLADLYCSYEDGLLIVKDTQTFTVKIPPISQDANFMTNIATGLQAIIGKSPIVDSSTRTIIYEATQRNAELASRYFQRMRSSTALIVFETYIWEVLLNSGNTTGISWSMLDTFGKFAGNLSITGSSDADLGTPISIGLPTTQGAAGGDFNPTDVFEFLSTFGAVKTISQPQITVLSGSQAKLRAADKENYVARVAETIDDGQTTTSVETSSVDTGFTITIGSAWDNATVYANIEISLTDVSEIEDFDFTSGGGGSTTVQLPKTTERELTTQVRVRPGDSLLIAGLVRESDAFDSSGPGITKPVIPTSRSATTQNLELVFLLRPRVIVFTSPSEEDHFNVLRHHKKDSGPIEPAPTSGDDAENLTFDYDFAPLKANAVQPQDTAVVPDEAETVPVPVDLLDPAGSIPGSVPR